MGQAKNRRLALERLQPMADRPCPVRALHDLQVCEGAQHVACRYCHGFWPVVQ